MLKVDIIRVEHFTSKNGKPCHMAWYVDSNKNDGNVLLPVKGFCPDWVQTGMKLGLRIVPDFRCNASFEFVKLDA